MEVVAKVRGQAADDERREIERDRTETSERQNGQGMGERAGHGALGTTRPAPGPPRSWGCNLEGRKAGRSGWGRVVIRVILLSVVPLRSLCLGASVVNFRWEEGGASDYDGLPRRVSGA